MKQPIKYDQNMFANIQEIQKQLREVLEPIAKTYIDFVIRLKAIMEPISESIRKSMKPIYENLSRVFHELEISHQFDYVLVEMNWPPIRFLSVEIQEEIVVLYNNEKYDLINEKLNLLIDGYFDNNYFRNLQNDWNNNLLISDRKEIICEALDNYEDQRYYSTVILAVSQIEGVIAKGFYHSGYLKGGVCQHSCQ